MTSYKVKSSDIKVRGKVVGFTKDGDSIIAYKNTKGVYFDIHNPDSHCPQQTRFFPSVKIMIDEINKILDIEKTKELAWW
jgi:hypothetical protein